jgi:hypothetical protein
VSGAFQVMARPLVTFNPAKSLQQNGTHFRSGFQLRNNPVVGSENVVVLSTNLRVDPIVRLQCDL